MGALGIVYYLRLNDKFRQAYQKDLKNRLRMTFTTDIERALQEEVRTCGMKPSEVLCCGMKPSEVLCCEINFH